MSTKFQMQIQKWAEKVDVEIKTFTKLTAFKVHDRVVMRTPVDTGRARASWNIVAGEQPDTSVQPASEWEGFSDPDRAEEVAQTKRKGVRAAHVYMISNNLPYIKRLEDGWSKQAPVGMVKLAIADVRTQLEVELGPV